MAEGGDAEKRAGEEDEDEEEAEGVVVVDMGAMEEGRREVTLEHKADPSALHFGARGPVRLGRHVFMIDTGGATGRCGQREAN